MAATKTVEITLEQAKAVINAHREAEYVAKAAEARKLIGRYFKYRNSYSGDHPKWWLYVMITTVDEVGNVSGLSFQHTSGGSIEVRHRDSVYVESGGWTEIAAVEFWKAVASLTETIATWFKPASGGVP